MMSSSTCRYADAIQRIEEIHARDTLDVNPIACSQLWMHDRKTQYAILLWHGYTSSPRLYYQLAPKFSDLGYNVWTPCLPHSGLADRLTNDHARLTRGEIIQFTNETIDAACGLGDQLIVGGESLGGVMAAWAAQQRAQVNRAVLINTAFAIHNVPENLNTLLARILLRLPNIFVWWDPSQREKLGPVHTYPRFSTHALAQTFLLAAQIHRDAKTQKPKARSILSITSAKDVAVNNRVIAEIVNRWRAHGADVAEYQFQGDQVPVLHDIIDPTQPKQNVDYFYPILIDLVTNEIKTARVTLREFVAADWATALAYQSDPRYLRFNEWETRNEIDVRAFVQRFIDWQSEQPRLKFQLAVEFDGRLIGNCGIRIADPEIRKAELGYELDPNYWDKGFATEAASAMLDFGFRELQLVHIKAWCIADNIASVHVLTKIGMKCESVVHEQKWFKGRWWDALTFGIAAEEYNR